MASDGGSLTGLSPQNIKLKHQLQELGAQPFYEKCLTNSDTGTHGRIVLPKAVALKQFSEYLEQQGASLPAQDVDGRTYEFKFRFWTNQQSRMFLIEGCSEVLKAYKLQFGDVIVFARKPNGMLVVGGRPAGPEDSGKRPAARHRPPRAEDRASAKRRKDSAPVADGIFRPAPGADYSRKVFHDSVYWVCVIDICGEPYRALFDFEADAWSAFRAACKLDDAAVSIGGGPMAGTPIALPASNGAMAPDAAALAGYGLPQPQHGGIGPPPMAMQLPLPMAGGMGSGMGPGMAPAMAPEGMPPNGFGGLPSGVPVPGQDPQHMPPAAPTESAQGLAPLPYATDDASQAMQGYNA